MISKKTLKMVGNIARNPATGDITGYATLRSLLENEFGLDPNLRDPVLGDIQKDLMKTLEEDPKHFSQHNQGLMFTAREAVFNPATGELVLSMVERADGRGSGFDDGQADGANSLAAARELVRRLHEVASDATKTDDHSTSARLTAEQRLIDVLEHAVFRVEVVVDLSGERLPKVCAHRNSNRRQKPISIVNHENGFAPLKVSLGQVAKDVAFYEGDRRLDGSKKRIDVVELVRAVIATADQRPASAYSNIGSAPKRYQEAIAEGNRRYLSATRNIGGLMTLLDAVDEAASRHVERANGSQRSFWGVTEPRGGFRPRFSGADRGLKYSVPDCFVLPVFSAVARNLMRDDGSWVQDPSSYFRAHRKELLDLVFAQYRRSKAGTTKFGSLPEVWTGLSEFVSEGRSN